MAESTGLPQPTMSALLAHRELTYELSQWAPTVHRLVRERIAALMDAYGPRDHPLERAEEYAQRVLAGGQYPFPEGTCLYDDLNCNTGYDHIEVGYGVPEDGQARITYSGSYPKWAPDGESYTREQAEIHCPAWLITDPDAITKFQQQTTEMAQRVRAEVEAERLDIEQRLEKLVAGHDGS
jgi:hypothetical protein